MNKIIITLVSVFALIVITAALVKTQRTRTPKPWTPSPEAIQDVKRKQFEECRARKTPMLTHCIPKCDSLAEHGILAESGMSYDDCLRGCALADFGTPLPSCAKLLE